MGPHKDAHVHTWKWRGTKVNNHSHTFHLPFFSLPLFFFVFLCTFSTCIFIFPLLLFVLCVHPLFNIFLIFNTSSFSFYCVFCAWPLFIFPFFVAIVGDFFLFYTLCIFILFMVFFVFSSFTFYPIYCSFLCTCKYVLCTLCFKFLLCTSMSIPSIGYITSHVIYYMSPFESSLQNRFHPMQ
jgi:hypothetical protein